MNSFFILEADGEIPEEIIGCAKILMMPIEEFKSSVLEGKKIPSTKLTTEVQTVLREILETKLAEYPSSAKDDKQILKQAATETAMTEEARRKKNAILVRSGERDIIQSVLDKVKKWRPPVPVAGSNNSGKQKGNAKGAHPSKGKKPYHKK
jgi:hypothetical protein